MGGLVYSLKNTQSIVNGKEVTTNHPVAYVSGMFHGSQLNWAAMMKEAYAIYMTVKKSTFYLTGADITLRSDHLPLNKFLQKNTLNLHVNNWAVEIESFKIKFVHIAGRDNMITDTLSHLIDIDPDIVLEPELKDYEFWFILALRPYLKLRDHLLQKNWPQLMV